MVSSAAHLRLFGLIQDLQREAAELGLTRTAAALEVTGAVAMEELSGNASRDGEGCARADAESLDEQND
ncbi:MAG: hypothetical protein U1E28_19510 [Beijerinckiaceae bacterium]